MKEQQTKGLLKRIGNLGIKTLLSKIPILSDFCFNLDLILNE